MSTETQVVSLESLQEEIVRLKAEAHTLTRNQSSRKGDVGARGETGKTGNPGRDAVLIVKTDTANNVVRIFDEHGTEKATLVPVEGPVGAPGRDAAPARDGVDGEDGRNAPSLDEIVRAVLQEVKAKL